MNKITVDELLRDQEENMKLSLLSGKKGVSRAITTTEISRLELVLAGHFTDFHPEHIQFCDKISCSYLHALPEETRVKRLKDLVTYSDKMPCIILAKDMHPDEGLISLSNEHFLPVLQTGVETGRFMGELGILLDKYIAPSIIMHGVLVEVYGLGVLIIGESGIGKSESALELVKRGHIIVADDIVEIKLRSGRTLVGGKKDLLGHNMEIRGLGIVDVEALFGISAILDKSKIEFVVKLIDSKSSSEEFDRLGIDEHSFNLLGVSIPEVTIPLSPGRNVAVLIEIAALNQRLKQRGHNPAEELNKKLIKKMASSKNTDNK